MHKLRPNNDKPIEKAHTTLRQIRTDKERQLRTDRDNLEQTETNFHLNIPPN
jgi:hypothetical protein